MNWKKEICCVFVTIMIGLTLMLLTRRVTHFIVTNTPAVTREFEVTAFCPCDICTNGDGITASGHTIQYGDKFCAASRDFEFYDKVTIPGYNNNRPTVVLDRGQAIQGDILDVYFDNHRDAVVWGRRTLQVTIYK